jgi:hypothetical protein
MAHRPSAPRARVTETYPRRALPLRARANCNLKAGPGSQQDTSVPSRDCPLSSASGLHHPSRARARPAALHRATSPPGADPDPSPCLRHRGYEHWPTSRDRAEERGGGDRKVYCPNAWLPPGYEPGAGDGVASAARQRGLFGLGTFWFDDATSRSTVDDALGRKPSNSTGRDSCTSVLSVEWAGSGHGHVGRVGRNGHGGHGGHGGPGRPQRRIGHGEHGERRWSQRAQWARAAGPATQRGATCHGGHGRRGAGHGRCRGHGPRSRRSRRGSRRHLWLSRRRSQRSR